RRTNKTATIVASLYQIFAPHSATCGSIIFMVHHLPPRKRSQKAIASRITYAVAKPQAADRPHSYFQHSQVGTTMTGQESPMATSVTNRVSPAPLKAKA